jgi:hypothetical protein
MIFNCSTLNFFIYEENFILFFISVVNQDTSVQYVLS